jgi:hypothetical protein
MRVRYGMAVIMVMAGVFAAACATYAQSGRGPNWAVLGDRVVTDRADHDTIRVGRDRGSFTAVKFEVRRHGVDFHRVVIHFANGEDQKVELRNSIPAGGETRVIDIDGSNRIITSIDFWYDAKTLGRGRSATVRSLGRH